MVGIECSLTRGNEREVVFPTVEECITEIKYIEPEYEEDEEMDETLDDMEIVEEGEEGVAE